MERLYGREQAIQQGRARLDRACQGEGGLLLFTGEPGIGKSRVAEHLSALATQAGATVAWGRCWEAGGAPPYWPWIQIFRGLHIDGDPFAPLDLPGDGQQARFQAFDLAARRLKEAAAQQPLVLVLDDLHAADVPSLLLLLLLARQLRESPILVLGAYREVEVRLAPDIASLLMKVAREGEVMPLARLPQDQVLAWIGQAWPHTGPAEAARLFRLTEGHPLFLVEALRLGSSAEAERRLLDGLGALLDEHLGHLSPDSRAVLQVAAVLGREFSADQIAATGVDRAAIAPALEQARSIGLVAATDERDRLRFAHLLLRDRLYLQLPPAARADLHWQVGGSQLARGLVQTAVHHLFEGHSAGGAGSPEKVAEVALTACEDSLQRLAFEDAAQLAERAARLLEGQGPPGRLSCQLQLVMAEAHIRLGEAVRARAACVQVAALARQLGASNLLVRAALVYGTDLVSGEVDPTMVALLRQALDALPAPDSPARARVTARLAAALSPPATRMSGPESPG